MITFKHITTRRVGDRVFDSFTGKECTIVERINDEGTPLYRVDVLARHPHGLPVRPLAYGACSKSACSARTRTRVGHANHGIEVRSSRHRSRVKLLPFIKPLISFVNFPSKIGDGISLE